MSLLVLPEDFFALRVNGLELSVELGERVRVTQISDHGDFALVDGKADQQVGVENFLAVRFQVIGDLFGIHIYDKRVRN